MCMCEGVREAYDWVISVTNGADKLLVSMDTTHTPLINDTKIALRGMHLCGCVYV